MREIIPTTQHPTTGLRYIHVLPGLHPFEDIRLMYTSFADRNSWSGVISSHTWLQTKDVLCTDSNTMIIMWSSAMSVIFGPPSSASPPLDHKAICTSVFYEALGELNSMLPVHQQEWASFCASAKDHDGIFTHTPRMAEAVTAATGVETFVLPVGWDPGIWQTRHPSKDACATFFGTMCGKRAVTMPVLRKLLGGKLIVFLAATFGNELYSQVEQHAATLNILHSDVWSFSTWRIWQSLMTESVMIAESPEDTWPMTLDHFISVNRIVPGVNERLVADEIFDAIGRASDGVMAKRMVDDLGSEYLLDRVVGNYLIPASERLLSKRRLKGV